MSASDPRLLENIEAFTAFARQQLGDAELARDAVQESLVKAMASENQPAEGEELRWFYRILRRTIIDLHRRRAARSRALERYAQELDAAPSQEEKTALCRCYQGALAEMPEAYRDLIQRIDLEDESIVSVAASRGVSANALGVQLYRARRRLREMLEATCRVCAEHGCLDCDCPESS